MEGHDSLANAQSDAASVTNRSAGFRSSSSVAQSRVRATKVATCNFVVFKMGQVLPYELAAIDTIRNALLAIKYSS